MIPLFIYLLTLYSIKNCECNPFELIFGKMFMFEPSVSYGELGTFERDGEMKHVGFLPSSPEEIGTTFLYKANNTKQRSISYNKPTSLKYIKHNSTIAIIVHGFHSSSHDSLIVKLRDSILNFTTTNATIIVDWENGANCLNYFQSVSNAQVVGRQIALLVDRIRKLRNINPKDVHLIGFSLGAQIAGFAGRWAKRRYKYTFGRISALDAAGYMFESYKIHIGKNDALFVDAIHTNAGSSVMNNEYGSLDPFGDVDFYPNGGTQQPQCANGTDRMCNHLAAIVYYQTSIKYLKSCFYLSVACDSYKKFIKKRCHLNNISRMGFYANTYNGTGKHYLQTTAPYPHKIPKPTKQLFYYPRKAKVKVTDETQSISSDGGPSLGSSVSSVSETASLEMTTSEITSTNKPTVETTITETEQQIEEKSKKHSIERETESKEIETTTEEATTTTTQEQTTTEEPNNREDTTVNNDHHNERSEL